MGTRLKFLNEPLRGTVYQDPVLWLSLEILFTPVEVLRGTSNTLTLTFLAQYPKRYFKGFTCGPFESEVL